MTRPRNRFLVFAIILLSVLFFGYRTWRSPEFQLRVRDLVEQEFGKIIDGDVSINKIKVGLLSVTVTGANIIIPLNSFEIHLDRLKIGFSLSSLIKKRWEPQDLIDKIIIIRPEIRLSPFSVDRSNPDELPLPAELSDRIISIFSFRKVQIKDCSIALLSPKGEKLLDFDNLDGEAVKDSSNLKFYLNGSHRSLRDNIFITGVISRNLDNEFINIILKNVDSDINIPENKLNLSTRINSDIEISFKNLPYPTALTPSGELSFSKIILSNNRDKIIKKGGMAFSMSNGRIISDSISYNTDLGNFTAEFNGSINPDTLGSSFSARLVNDSFNVNLNLSAKSLIDTTASINLLFNGDSLDIPLSLNLRGEVNSAKLTVDNYKITSNYIHGKGEGVINYNGKYHISNSSNIAYKSFSSKLNMKIFGDNFRDYPTVRGGVQKTKIKVDKNAVTIPNLKILSDKKNGVKITGSDKNFTIVSMAKSLGTISNNHKLSVTVKSAGLQKLSTLVNINSGKISNGVLTVDVVGSNGTENINYGLSLSNNDINAKIFGTALFSKRKEIISIDNGEITRGDASVKLSGNIFKKRDVWQIKLNDLDNMFKIRGEINENFSNVNSVDILGEAVPLLWIKQVSGNRDIAVKKGKVFAQVNCFGPIDNITTEGLISVTDASLGNMNGINASFSITVNKSDISVSPFSIYRDDSISVMAVRRCRVINGVPEINGLIKNFDIASIPGVSKKDQLSGTLAGKIYSKEGDIYLRFFSDKIEKQGTILNSVSGVIHREKQKIIADSIKFTHNKLKGRLAISYPLNQKSSDTLSFDIKLRGDILASLGKFPEIGVGGSSDGQLDIVGGISEGEYFFNKGRLIISNGEMTVYPYVRGAIKNFYCDVNMFRTDSVDVKLRGLVGKKTLVIKNRYDYSDSLSPLKFGPIDLGVLNVFTDKGGIPIFIPGFLENRRGNVISVEALGKKEIDAFTLSGPANEFKVTGTLKLRKGEITFPFLDDVVYPLEIDVFPFITWDLDIHAADNSVQYFYRVGTKKTRRAIKIVECTLDPARTIGVRGRDLDKTFQVVGSLESYRGSLFYGKLFHQNFNMGLDFQPIPLAEGGYDNTPIIFGSAETIDPSDTTGLSKSVVTIMTRNSETHKLEKVGRFTELVIVPANESDSLNNSTEEEADFYKGTKKILDPTEVGEFIGGVGDRYLSSYLFNYWGTQLVRKMGLDMMRVETSFMSNSSDFISDKQANPENDYSFSRRAFNNTGVTLGKYLFQDNVLLKVGTKLSMEDSLIAPTYRFGFEYQPLRYLWMDFDYGITQGGINGLTDEREIIMDPAVKLQLRVPLSDFKHMFRGK